MNCPSCETPMETIEMDRLRFEQCPNCGGIWFEGGELNQAIEQALPDAQWLEFDLWKDVEAMSLHWGDRQCQVCWKTMAQITYADTGVVVDYCVEGHGVFLDQGEFEVILAALEEEVSAKDLPEYLRAALREGSEVVTGDDGLASEWKDFTTVLRLLQYRVLAENPRLARALVAFQSANPLK